MECCAEKKIVRDQAGFSYLPVFLAALCLAGAVTGTVVFSRSYTDADVAAYIDAQRAMPVDFGGYFVRFLLAEVPYFAGLLFAAIFVPGWLIAPVSLLMGGLNLGTSVCCLYSGCGLWGVLYALTVVAVPAICVMISRAILCHGSMLLSMQLLRALIRRDNAGSVVGKLIIKIPLCAAVDLFAAAFAAFMRTIMYRFIS